MDWRYNTIWFDQLPQDDILRIDLRETKLGPIDGKRYVILRGYRQKNGLLDAFPKSSAIDYLELNFSNLQSFTGIDRLSLIKRLEIHYCYKLSSDVGLSQVSGSLRHLHINQCKKFTFGEDLLSLHNIEILCLNSCGDIEDLSFLESFPKLVDFRFVDTNVRNGDLSPLLNHPSLRSVGFLNKRHYNFSSDTIDQHFEKRNFDSGRRYVTRGQWRTFRYLTAEEFKRTKTAQQDASSNGG